VRPQRAARATNPSAKGPFFPTGSGFLGENPYSPVVRRTLEDPRPFL
jgi:hypothetical protein